jgi:hypothetical protein
MEMQVDNAAFLQELRRGGVLRLYIAGSGKYFKVAVTKLAIHSGPPPPEQG